MTGPDEHTTQSPAARQLCLVDGCSCKDTRIVSTRRTGFIAERARINGETADRFIAAEPTWRLPADPSS
jgi:hypothetical protein